MRIKFSILFFAFAFAAFTATAQTETPKTETETAEKVWVPEKTPPVAEHYEGGVEAMYKFIQSELKYPALAKRNRKQGICIISFTLNDDGSTSGHRILSEVGGGTGEEALRVARLLKFKAPGYSIVGSIPIMFKL